MSKYDDFTSSGYASSMSFDQWIVQNSPPTVFISADRAYDDYTNSGNASSMSFSRYCSDRGIAPIGYNPQHGSSVSEPERVRKVRQVKVNPSDAKRQELMEMAEARAEAITAISSEVIDDWRIANGYYWKAVSPSGKVYSEVLKAVTVKEPDNYVEFNAMKIAHFRIVGYGY